MNSSLTSTQRELVKENLALAVRLAKDTLRAYPYIRLSSGEIRSIAGEALCSSASKFDPSKGARFSTFMYLRVRGAVISHIQDYTSFWSKHCKPTWGSDGSSATHSHVLASPCQISRLETRMALKKAFSTLTAEEASGFVNFHAHGYSFRDLEQFGHLPKHRVYKRLKSIAKEVRESLDFDSIAA